MAPANPQPKVLLFDIGGVCVLSPFQAILDYELTHGIPPGWVNNCISKTKPNGFWHRLERGEMLMDAAWFRGFSSDLNSPTLWKAYYAAARAKDPSLSPTTPPTPQIDGEKLFWAMMDGAREPDLWMFPALKALKSSGRYILAALSNTMIYPEGHRLADAHSNVRAIFDVFISSAHVGMRKPDAEIYEYTVRTLSSYSNSIGRGEIKPSDILFLDDIGENLKAAKTQGFGTIKVILGRAYEAVDALEEATGLKLAGTHPRVPILSKAKL